MTTITQYAWSLIRKGRRLFHPKTRFYPQQLVLRLPIYPATDAGDLIALLQEVAQQIATGKIRIHEDDEAVLTFSGQITGSWEVHNGKPVWE